MYGVMRLYGVKMAAPDGLQIFRKTFGTYIYYVQLWAVILYNVYSSILYHEPQIWMMTVEIGKRR